jgi:methylated-DNA-[protein]-cysteine S-methyltransferase
LRQEKVNLKASFRYETIKTRFGWMGILASAKGVVATSLPRVTQEEARRAMGPLASSAVTDREGLSGLVRRITAYFEGQQIAFTDDVDIISGTPFQRRVWQATRGIGYGQTRTYVEIARDAGSPLAARATGQALGANPVPIIIPCHRVIGRDGSLTGFGGGLEMKQLLLEMEKGRRT